MSMAARVLLRCFFSAPLPFRVIFSLANNDGGSSIMPFIFLFNIHIHTHPRLHLRIRSPVPMVSECLLPFCSIHCVFTLLWPLHCFSSSCLLLPVFIYTHQPVPMVSEHHCLFVPFVLAFAHSVSTSLHTLVFLTTSYFCSSPSSQTLSRHQWCPRCFSFCSSPSSRILS